MDEPQLPFPEKFLRDERDAKRRSGVPALPEMVEDTPDSDEVLHHAWEEQPATD